MAAMSTPAANPTTPGSGTSRSGPCPDLVANQRSRGDGSSAAATVRQPLALPHHSNETSALDASGSDPLLAAAAPKGSGAPRLLTADDVAVILRVPRSLIYALARRGELPAIRIGERYVRFRGEAIERWLERREGADRELGEPSSVRRTIGRTGGSSPISDRGASGTSLRRRANAPEPGIRRVDPDAS